MSRKRSPNADWSFLPASALPGRHGVYVVRDSAGQVLYVGFTRDLRRRMARGHRYRSAWFAQMASVDFHPCGGLTEARVLEKALIAQHRPAANIKYVRSLAAPRRPLPDDAVARLVELDESYADAHLWHREAETAALIGYILELRRAGYTFAAIGYALDMTRQAMQQRIAHWLAAEVSTRAAA